MPLANRIVSVVAGEADEYRLRPDAPWQLVNVVLTGNRPGLVVGAHNPAQPWAVPGLSQSEDSAASVFPADGGAYFLPIGLSVSVVAAIGKALQGTTAILGPLDRNGDQYSADDQVTLGVVTGGSNLPGNPRGAAPFDSRIDRWLAGIRTLQPLTSPAFSHRLGSQITFRIGRPAVQTFSAWCELLDITASDELELTASGVQESGQQYDVRLRVAFDSRWSTELVVNFEGREYSVVNVAEDTEREAKRYQVIGLRRLEG